VHNFEGHMGGYVAALRRKPDLCMWDGSVFQGIKPLLADHN